jgi:hypothetical protein
MTCGLPVVSERGGLRALGYLHFNRLLGVLYLSWVPEIDGEAERRILDAKQIRNRLMHPKRLRSLRVGSGHSSGSRSYRMDWQAGPLQASRVLGGKMGSLSGRQLFELRRACSRQRMVAGSQVLHLGSARDFDDPLVASLVEPSPFSSFSSSTKSNVATSGARTG